MLSLVSTASCRGRQNQRISRSLERLDVITIVSLCNSTAWHLGNTAAEVPVKFLLPRCLSNFRAIWKVLETLNLAASSVGLERYISIGHYALRPKCRLTPLLAIVGQHSVSWTLLMIIIYHTDSACQKHHICQARTHFRKKGYFFYGRCEFTKSRTRGNFSGLSPQNLKKG